jgi:hypothetical protein
MNVTGSKALIEDSGELDDAIATIKAAALDPEHFDIEVYRMPDVVDPRTGLYPIRYAVEITNRASGRGATVAGARARRGCSVSSRSLQRANLTDGNGPVRALSSAQ